MAIVLRTFRDTVSVVYGTFILDELDSSGPGPSQSGGILDLRSGLLRVETAISHGKADVRMESWDADPPPAPAPWVEMGEIAYPSIAAIMTLGDDEGDRSIEALVLGPRHFLYGVRGYHVPSRDRDSDFWEDPQRAHVLVRFWPLEDIFDPARDALPSWARTGEPTPCPSGYVPTMDWPVLRRRPAPPPQESEPDVTDTAYPWRVRAEHRRRTGVRHDLDPEGAPTYSVRRRDLIAFGSTEAGTSHRVTVPAPAIVTVLVDDDDVLTVRAAAPAEAARIMASERAWPAEGRRCV